MRDMDFAGIARRVERKQGTSLVGLVREVVPVADGWMAFDGQGSPINKVCGIGFERPLTEAELDGIIAFFTERGVEPRVEVTPFAPPALLEGLARRGFALREFENVLVRELHGNEELRASLPRGWPAGVSVERVDSADPAAVREYVEVSMSGFFPEGMPLPEVVLEFGIRYAGLPRYDLFVARIGGEIVGATGCESAEGVSLIFGNSVKPAYRRRGVQQALFAASLERGRERGSHLAIINSLPGVSSERNAVRLGFSPMYSRASVVRPLEGPKS